MTATSWKRTPQSMDARNLALHALVVGKLRTQLALFERVRANIARSLSQCSGKRLAYLAPWKEIVNLGLEATMAAAIEPSDRGSALRKLSPFAGVLDEDERLAFLVGWARDNSR